MSLRLRLGLSFFAILVLLGINQGIYFWSNRLRADTRTALERALNRQIVIASVAHDLDTLQKQVALLSQILTEPGSGADPEARQLFQEKLGMVSAEVEQLKKLSDARSRSHADELGARFASLAEEWKAFYQYAQADQGMAMAELIRAEPLSRQLLTELVPRLQEDEKQRVQDAEEAFDRVSRVTNRMVLVIFVLSVLVAVGVAWSVSRHISTVLGELMRGTALIGSEMLDCRIPIQSRDELGHLAEAFNDMAEHLQTARTHLLEANQKLETHSQEIEKQRQLSDSLLRNILPEQVAHELENKGSVDPKYFEDVTIIFTDFVGFTLSTEKLAAEDLVQRLHDYFTAFDLIAARYHLEKLKTIGDSYMCVAGLPLDRRKRRNPSHPVDAVLAALEMVDAVVERLRPDLTLPWYVRVGIHTGPVIAGVVGIQKFAFDIWGDTVNYASRMESSGAADRINISERTHSRVKDFFDCEHRGKVATKEKKEMDMYFVNGVLPELLCDVSSMPPPAFLRRYRIYFQKDPPAFPLGVVSAARHPKTLPEAEPKAFPTA